MEDVNRHRQRKEHFMPTSRRFKLSIVPAAAVLVTMAMPTFVLPASAQSSRYDVGMGESYRSHKRPAIIISRGARNASNMEIGPGFQLDPNSPEATGGGSLGYNRKLLED